MAETAHRRLILFDVDGTLIARGDPAHLAAIDAGLSRSYPDLAVSIRDIDFDGKVDRQIVREMLTVGGVPGEIDLGALRAMLDAAVMAYRDSWGGRMGDDDLLPGVRTLVERLSRDPRFALGVLTGGVRGIVEAKLRRLSLETFFTVGAFGDEVEARDELLSLALRRANDHFGLTFDLSRIVVVGDTPHDVRAAHAGGVACLAVATGRFSVNELAAAGADVVLPNLSDTDEVVATLSSVRRFVWT